MRCLLLLLLLPAMATSGQTIKGKLFGQEGDNKEILPGGTLHWIGTPTGTTANENGVFELPVTGVADMRIVASMVGYTTDTINVAGKTYVSIVLKPESHVLDGVTVNDRNNISLATAEVGKVEVVGKHELVKAACCDLAGCFGTQASVQPQTTNVITNAQELRILGLSGVYNQVLVDGMPMISGLSYTYGISTYPGSIVNNIFVAKGTTSVLQGYESISGQINLDAKWPDKMERLYLNGYMNSFGEKQENVNLSAMVGKRKKWSTMIALHAVQPANRTDGNKDGFMDLPLLTRYMAYNKWKYGSDRQKGWNAQLALRVLNERRIGGQVNYMRGDDEGSLAVYGQKVNLAQSEVYAKAGYRLNGRHAIALAVSGFVHDQLSWFGSTRYKAEQQNGYLNLQHEWQWSKHTLKYGMSYRYQELAEHIQFGDTNLHRTYAGNYLTQLRVPGAFAENAWHWNDDKVILLTGVRVDNHQVAGAFVVPRVMVKYVVNSMHTLRASAGKGWRQVNLFSEQVNLLISSRDIVFAEALKPEEAWNQGVTYTYKFAGLKTTGTVNVDFFNTYFTRQFFPDYDSEPTKAIIRNFTGKSISNGLQVDASMTVGKVLDLRVAYNYLDVYRMEKGGKNHLPFNPKNRAMAAISYRTKNNKWQADMNAHWFDKMRLPDTRNNPAPFVRPMYSTAYGTLNVQATYRWKNLDVYAGCENITNYRQPDPIISADNPFGPYFDISSVWGPTRGREVYAGFRYIMN